MNGALRLRQGQAARWFGAHPCVPIAGRQPAIRQQRAHRGAGHDLRQPGVLPVTVRLASSRQGYMIQPQSDHPQSVQRRYSGHRGGGNFGMYVVQVLKLLVLMKLQVPRRLPGVQR